MRIKDTNKETITTISKSPLEFIEKMRSIETEGSEKKNTDYVKTSEFMKIFDALFEEILSEEDKSMSKSSGVSYYTWIKGIIEERYHRLELSGKYRENPDVIIPQIIKELEENKNVILKIRSLSCETSGFRRLVTRALPLEDQKRLEKLLEEPMSTFTQALTSLGIEVHCTRSVPAFEYTFTRLTDATKDLIYFMEPDPKGLP